MASRRVPWAAWLGSYRSMSSPARLGWALVLALVVVGAASFYWRDAHPQRVGLFETDEISPQQLAAMRSAFDSAGLTDYSFNAGRIEVPKDASARYLAALAQRRDLPSYRFFEEVFQGHHWLTPQRDLDRQWDLASQQFLAEIIREMEGVEQAWVSWDAAPKRGLRAREDVRASVGVKMLPGHMLRPRIEAAIRDLVVGSRAGLVPERVTVVDLSEMTDDAHLGRQSGAERLNQIRRLEQHYTEKLEKLLAFIDGVIISVDVTPLPAQSNEAPAETERTQSDVDPSVADDANRQVDSSVADQQNHREQDARIPPATVASQSAVMLHERDGASAAADVPHPAAEQLELLPTRIAVTVGVPDEYMVPAAQVVGRHNPSGAEIQTEDDRIRRLVAAALRESVEVSVHRYRKRRSSAQSGVVAWLDFGDTAAVSVGGAMALLTAALLILVVRSSVLSARLRRVALPGTATGGSHAPRPHEHQLRDEVQAMVRREPDRTARVLQSWIHQGSKP